MKNLTEEDVDKLFRHADFSYENSDFKLQLYKKLLSRLEESEEQELKSEEFLQAVAGGNCTRCRCDGRGWVLKDF